MAKKLTKKQKNQLAIKLMIFSIVCMVAIGSFVYYKVTTPPTLESVISDVMFDTSEITLDVTITNKNEEIKYKYVVSDDNNYIKIVKQYDDITETSIVYQQDNMFYLYVNKETEVTIELQESDAYSLFNNLKKEVYDLESYLELDYDAVKYYYYSKEYVEFSNYRNNVFYDNKIVIENDKLVSLTQVFGVNNVLNTIVVNVNYDVILEKPLAS